MYNNFSSRRSGAYSAWAYIAAKLVTDGLLLRALPAVLYAALFYPLAGFSPQSHRAAAFFLLLASYTCAVGALAVAAAALFRSSAAASLLLNSLLLWWVLLGGFLVNPDSIPAWLRWARYATPFTFANEALLTNEASGRLYYIKIPDVAGVILEAETLLLTFGAQPDRGAVQSFGIVAAFYGGFAALAAALYARAARPPPR